MLLASPVVLVISGALLEPPMATDLSLAGETPFQFPESSHAPELAADFHSASAPNAAPENASLKASATGRSGIFVFHLLFRLFHVKAPDVKRSKEQQGEDRKTKTLARDDGIRLAREVLPDMVRRETRGAGNLPFVHGEEGKRSHERGGFVPGMTGRQA
jgi:hypothetical protein